MSRDMVRSHNWQDTFDVTSVMAPLTKALNPDPHQGVSQVLINCNISQVLSVAFTFEHTGSKDVSGNVSLSVHHFGTESNISSAVDCHEI